MLADALPAGAGDRRTWSGLGGSARGLAIAEATASRDGLVVVITPDAASAARLESEIRFYAGDAGEGVMHFLFQWGC